MNNVVVENLVNSKIYVRNNISYMQPSSIINPFLDILGYGKEFGGEVFIQTQNEVVNQNIGGDENIAYPRFLVELRKSEVLFGDVQYQNTFGLLVAMDQQNPLVKVYTGMNVSACTNLCIFNAEHVFQQNLMESLDNTFNAVKMYANNEQQKIDDYRKTHERLVNTVMNQEQLNERLGYLLRMANTTKLGTSPIVGAAKLLSDRKSVYFTDKESTLYNLYNAVTQGITDSADLFYKTDKTLGLTRLLLN